MQAKKPFTTLQSSTSKAFQLYSHRSSKLKDSLKPFISREVMEWLNRMYPEPAINPEQTMADIQYQAGRRSVVRFVNLVYKNQDGQNVNIIPNGEN